MDMAEDIFNSIPGREITLPENIDPKFLTGVSIPEEIFFRVESLGLDLLGVLVALSGKRNEDHFSRSPSNVFLSGRNFLVSMTSGEYAMFDMDGRPVRKISGEPEFSGNFLPACFRPEKIVVPEGFSGISTYAFLGHPEISEIILPKSLKTIGDMAFVGTGIRRISIPENVVSVGKSVFLNCPNLETVRIPRILEFEIDESRKIGVERY